MNFQGLSKIEDYKEYVDQAFKRAKKAANEHRSELDRSGKNRMEKSRSIELSRITAIKASLTKSLSTILTSYPSLDSLAEFYRELIKAFLDYKTIKKALGALGWAIKKIISFSDEYKIKINKCEELTKINDYRKQFYGRASSVLKQIKNELALLDESRKIMNEFPSIKQNMPTHALVGFPNVGKSTLLSKLTPSTPDIQSYAFTTKRINIGYMNRGHEKIQLMDTPGTLNRIDKMNSVEKQAYLAIKYCADKMVYVFDLTESSGFSIEKQLKLYKKLKDDFPQEMIIYFSKADLLESKDIEEFIKEHKLKRVMDVDEIKEKI